MICRNTDSVTAMTSKRIKEQIRKIGHCKQILILHLELQSDQVFPTESQTTLDRVRVDNPI